MSSETVCSKDQCNPANEVETGSEAEVSEPVPVTIRCHSCVRAGFSCALPRIPGWKASNQHHRTLVQESGSRLLPPERQKVPGTKCLKKFPWRSYLRNVVWNLGKKWVNNSSFLPRSWWTLKEAKWTEPLRGWSVLSKWNGYWPLSVCELYENHFHVA